MLNMACWLLRMGRVGAVTAKYGEKSVYFDLGDISNTTGKWDLYGNDEPNRYNGLQVHTHYSRILLELRPGSIAFLFFEACLERLVVALFRF
jgi:hypothetical protein